MISHTTERESDVMPALIVARCQPNAVITPPLSGQAARSDVGTEYVAMDTELTSCNIRDGSG